MTKSIGHEAMARYRKFVKKASSGDRNYDDPQYKQWRKDVAKRDMFTCQWPGHVDNKYLRFHHIRKWADYPSLRFEVDNGITLCRKHHDAIWGKEDDYIMLFLTIVANIKRNGKPANIFKWRKRDKAKEINRLKILQDIRAEIRR